MLTSREMKEITDVETLKRMHNEHSDKLAELKREYFQQRASYEQLSDAAIDVVTIRMQIERVKFGKVRMSRRQADQMHKSLMR